MNKTPLGHMQCNVNGENIGFYRDLMGFLGWETLYDADGSLGAGGDHGQSIWFIGAAKAVSNDYDGPGMNHLAFAAVSIADVDEAASYLRGRDVEALYDTPCHRPEMSASDDDTYYSLMFESPDRILFEIVYTGPK